MIKPRLAHLEELEVARLALAGRLLGADLRGSGQTEQGMPVAEHPAEPSLRAEPSQPQPSPAEQRGLIMPAQQQAWWALQEQLVPMLERGAEGGAGGGRHSLTLIL